MALRMIGRSGSVRRRRSLAVATAVAAMGVVSVGAGVLPGAAGAASATSTVKMVNNKTWGPILVLGNGDTLYRLTADPKGQSVCSGQCAQIWPPAVVSGTKVTAGSGVTAKNLGVIMRSNGKHQITYEGIPLYTYSKDHGAGQVTGNIKDTWGQWWVVNPSSPMATPTAKAGSSPSTTSPSNSSGGSSSGTGGAAF